MHRDPVLPGIRLVTENRAVEESSSPTDTVPALHEFPPEEVRPVNVALEAVQTRVALVNRPPRISSSGRVRLSRRRSGDGCDPEPADPESSLPAPGDPEASHPKNVDP